MRQAIIWTHADPIHWRIYAALGGDELMKHHIQGKLNISTAGSTIYGTRTRARIQYEDVVLSV